MKFQPILFLILALVMGASAIFSMPEKPWYDTARSLSLALSVLFLAIFSYSGNKLFQYVSWAFGGAFVALLVYRLILLAT